MANLGPASTTTVNTQIPYSTERTVQTIAVSMTPLSVATITVAEQSFGANGVSQVTAATGILAGDVILAISPPSVGTAVGVASFRVDTAVNDKFYVAWVNPTAGALVPSAGTYLITVARYSQSVSTTPGTLSTLPSTVQ